MIDVNMNDLFMWSKGEVLPLLYNKKLIGLSFNHEQTALLEGSITVFCSTVYADNDFFSIEEVVKAVMEYRDFLNGIPDRWEIVGGRDETPVIVVWT